MAERAASGHSPAFDLFHRAILDKKQIACSYGGYARETCPYILGHKAGREAALVFQFGGSSSRGLSPRCDWRCSYLDEVRDVVLRDGAWLGEAQHRTRQQCVDDVFIDVNLDVPNQPGREPNR